MGRKRGVQSVDYPRKPPNILKVCNRTLRVVLHLQTHLPPQPGVTQRRFCLRTKEYLHTHTRRTLSFILVFRRNEFPLLLCPSKLLLHYFPFFNLRKRLKCQFTLTRVQISVFAPLSCHSCLSLGEKTNLTTRNSFWRKSHARVSRQ